MEQARTAVYKKKSGAAGVLVKLVLIALLIYAGTTLYHLQGQIQVARGEEAALAAQVQSLADENESLRADIAAAGDPEKLEEVARDELGMVKNGEKVFYDTSY